MSGFRAEALLRGRLAYAAPLLIGLAAGIASTAAAAGPLLLAQAGPPVRLTPTPPAAPAADPPQAQPQRPETSTPAVPYIPGSETKIEVTQPAPISTDSLGVKDPAQVHLPDALWKGSARALIEQLIDGLPNAFTSRTERAVLQRLLIVSSPAPAGDGAVPGRSFAGMRAAKLFAIGDIEDSSAIAQLLPSRGEDETTARLQLDSALAAYDNAGACTTVRAQIARFTKPYWQKALVFCQLLANEPARAQLGLSLLHEQQAAAEDVAFERLVAKLSGETKVTVDKLPDPTPLHLAMMRAANLPLPADVAAASDPVILRMVATSPNAPLELRLAAAEHAEAIGALPAETVAELYDAIQFSAEQIADALAILEKDRGPRGRAAVHRAARQLPIGIQRAEMLQKSWKVARERGVYPTVVRADIPLVVEMTPEPDLLFFAGDAVRALLFAGRLEEAQRWYAEVRAAAASNNELAANTDALLSPLMWLADPDERKTNTPTLTARFDAWRKAQESLDASAFPQRSALLVTLLTATGDRPDPTLLGPLLQAKAAPDSGAMPSMGLWLGLGAAFEAGRIGETALFALSILGPNGAIGAAPQATAMSLDGLRAVSLDPDARALAIEAAVMGGL